MQQKYIFKLEKELKRRPSVKKTVVLALRYWLAYKQDETKIEYLHKANYTVVSALRINESDIRLYLPTIFFAIELGNYDNAREMLDNAYAYRAFYKKNQPANYKLLRFLYALLEIRQGQQNAAKKHMKFLIKDGQFLLQGLLYIELGDYDNAVKALSHNYEQGNSSIFMWVGLHKCYHAAPESKQVNLQLYSKSIRWALRQGFNIKRLLPSSNIKRRALWDEVCYLSKLENGEYHKTIANVAYKLLLKSHYDKNVLDVVLYNFVGTQKQWLDLSKTLSAISIRDSRLDEIILKNAAWGRHFDKETQRVFANRGDTTDKCLHDFLHLAARCIIVDEVKPINEAITSMEKICTEQDKPIDTTLLTYTLSHVYIMHDISTNKSNAIINMAINAQEKSNLLFPIFKLTKLGGKLNSTAYIEKYRPFMYKALPGKSVYLYYKMAGEEDSSWRSIAMDYWQFGVYLAKVSVFYNERIEYYFSEELPTGSISTRVEEMHNGDVYISDDAEDDQFFRINNACVYEKMFNYDKVEDIISEIVKDTKMVRGRLM